MINAKITGTGSYLPKNAVSNASLVEKLAVKGIETSDEWIFSRSGISNRHYVLDETTSLMAAIAAKNAIQMADIDKDGIDLIIVATSTPDNIFPSVAAMVQQHLNIRNNCPCFDVQAVCAGFIYGLTIATQFISTGMYRNILVIGAETFSNLLDFNDRTTCVLFGDGAGAIVLSADYSNNQGILACSLYTNGHEIDILCAKGRVKNGSIVGNPFIHMDGQAVFKLAVKCLEHVAIEVLGKAGIKASDINWLIPHQANIRIMEGTAKKLALPLEKLVATVGQHGNTSAASIPLALDVAVRDARVKPNDLVLLEGVGAGFSWGAVALRF
jgi:3-oxoacyl-[acyl-carrier-protein] synthase III